ncbi:ATP:cob(I)alamin adenosyltransferase [bacterium DOLJORAL78_65_58]|nr:MAG: ATP:cob(I)alamin adenosyltransferase [bacterium DOLJORAL78_65_58]
MDELNSFLGVAVALLNEEPGLTDYAGVDIPVVLEELQNRLFDLGAVLANPVQSAEPASFPAQGMEKLIDTLEQELEPLRSFILPGGHPAAAHLHVARAASRRVERLAVALAATEPVPASAVAWLNRLSDFLFVAARAVNAAAGRGDVLWHPQEAPGPGGDI